jgi:hypothetical protein
MPDPSSACSRCGRSPAPHHWTPTPETAKRGFGELRLCDRCLEAFRSYMAQGKNPAKRAKIKRGPGQP